MRIATVRIHGNDRRIVGQQVFALESFHDPLLHLVFVGTAVTHAAPDFLERGGGDWVDRIAALRNDS